MDDARRIIVEGWDPADRPTDAHDVRCAFTIVSDEEEMARGASSRRTGGTEFVAHGLVDGTLREGFARLASLTDPFQRAVFVMFLMAEVHPVDDGNGRLACVFMNAELAGRGSAAHRDPVGLSRRLPERLRALSRWANPVPLHRMLAFAQDVARGIDWSDYDTARRMLEDANAFLTPDEAEDTGRRLRIP